MATEHPTVADSRHMLVLQRLNDAGWSSLVAREAHNLEVVGSNPAPATCPGVETCFDPGVIFFAHV